MQEGETCLQNDPSRIESDDQLYSLSHWEKILVVHCHNYQLGLFNEVNLRRAQLVHVQVQFPVPDIYFGM